MPRAVPLADEFCPFREEDGKLELCWKGTVFYRSLRGNPKKGGMVVNEKNLALEQRYNKHLSSEVYRLLKNKQQFSKEKIEEIVKWGMVSEEDLMINFFGRPRSEAKGKELHTKMKQDLIGW